MFGRYGALSPELVTTLTETASALAQTGVAVAGRVRDSRAAKAQALLDAQAQAAALHQQERLALAQQQAGIATGQNTVWIAAILGALGLIGLAIYVKNNRKA